MAQVAARPHNRAACAGTAHAPTCCLNPPACLQNLGAMDILCTDKTGTLTQDQVRPWDGQGLEGLSPKGSVRLCPGLGLDEGRAASEAAGFVCEVEVPSRRSCPPGRSRSNRCIRTGRAGWALFPALACPSFSACCSAILQKPAIHCQAHQVVLTRWLDWRGVKSAPVLRYGFLNAFFQTGSRNLLDAAILDSGWRPTKQSTYLSLHRSACCSCPPAPACAASCALTEAALDAGAEPDVAPQPSQLVVPEDFCSSLAVQARRPGWRARLSTTSGLTSCPLTLCGAGCRWYCR